MLKRLRFHLLAPLKFWLIWQITNPGMYKNFRSLRANRQDLYEWQWKLHDERIKIRMEREANRCLK